MAAILNELYNHMKLFSLFSFLQFLCLFSFGQTMQTPKDYLNFPGPVTIVKTQYNFAWSSHPNANYYKHEYIPSNNTLEKYKSMVLVEVLAGEYNPSDIAGAKVAELKKLKENNPVVNYNIFQKNEEIILDFLITDNAPNGNVNIIERNIYRYKSTMDKNGKKYLILFGISERGYGNDVKNFLANLKSNKNVLLNEMAKLPMPDIKITD
ncbi:MAG: hypothetical protein JST02_05095 [Bacteroidetes bacterium]|nr:hypothetical protein [Bacteroidota bacterium]